MGLYRNNNETSEIYRFGKYTTEIWSFFNNEWMVVWSAIKSCFGNGFWSNNEPWSNDEPWNNGV